MIVSMCISEQNGTKRNNAATEQCVVWQTHRIHKIIPQTPIDADEKEKREKERSRYNITSNNVDARGHSLRVYLYYLATYNIV